jgi:predicted dinucleotide-binding enzyme
MTTIGIIGAGHIGSALARASLDAGYDVVLANSRGPQTLTDLVGGLADRTTSQGRVRAGTVQEAAAAADLAVVTVPLKAIPQIPAEPLAGKVVIDTCNYYPQRDGHIEELEGESATSSQLVQRHLQASRVVKAFNHIYAADITARRMPPGTPHRRALAIFGDDAAAREVVASYIEELGFDVVDLGPLSESWRLQPGTAAYGPDMDAAELREAAAGAHRAAEPD